MLEKALKDINENIINEDLGLLETIEYPLTIKEDIRARVFNRILSIPEKETQNKYFRRYYNLK